MTNDLILVAPEQRALTVRMILESQGGRTADAALILLADKAGDEAVASIVSQLRPIDISQLVQQFDYTKQSIVSEFLTPKQVADALRTLDEDITSVMFSLVFSSDDDQRSSEVLAAIDDTPWGHLMLQLAIIEEDFEDIFAELVRFGTVYGVRMNRHHLPPFEWLHLICALKEFHYSRFTRMVTELQAIITAHAGDYQVVYDILTEQLREHTEQDASEIGEQSQSQVDDLFTPLS